MLKRYGNFILSDYKHLSIKSIKAFFKYKNTLKNLYLPLDYEITAEGQQ